MFSQALFYFLFIYISLFHFIFVSFEKRSFGVQVGFKLTIELRLTLNLQSSCAHLPSDGITGIYHSAWLRATYIHPGISQSGF